MMWLNYSSCCYITYSDVGSSFGASYIYYMGQRTVKLRYFKDLICAPSPDLFTLFSSSQRLETILSIGTDWNDFPNLQEA